MEYKWTFCLTSYCCHPTWHTHHSHLSHLRTKKVSLVVLYLVVAAPPCVDTTATIQSNNHQWSSVEVMITYVTASVIARSPSETKHKEYATYPWSHSVSFQLFFSILSPRETLAKREQDLLEEVCGSFITCFIHTMMFPAHTKNSPHASHTLPPRHWRERQVLSFAPVRLLYLQSHQKIRIQTRPSSVNIVLSVSRALMLVTARLNSNKTWVIPCTEKLLRGLNLINTSPFV